MRPSSSSFTNTRPGSLKAQSGTFAPTPNPLFSDRFATSDRNITPQKTASSRKPAGKSISDMLPTNTINSRPLNSRKPPHKGSAQYQSVSNSQSSLASDSKPNTYRPNVLPRSTYTITHNATRSLGQSRQYGRTQYQNPTPNLKDDENPSINRIPLSPIGIKRAVSPQMGMPSLDEIPESENLWTENLEFENTNYRGLKNLNIGTYHTVKKESIDLTTGPRRHFTDNKAALSMTSPIETADLKSLTDVTNGGSILNGDMSCRAKAHTVNESIGSINMIPEFPRGTSKDVFSSTLSYRRMNENQTNISNQNKGLQVPMNTDISEGTLKSPGRGRPSYMDLTIRLKPAHSENLDQTSIKTSVSTLQSPPKVRLANGSIEDIKGRNSSTTLDGFKAYISRLNKFDISRSTSMIKQIFQPKKRLKCSCESNLDEDQSCSRAMSWIKKKYNPNEFEYLKSTYEKILSENRLVNAEQSKQIQKDLHRTYPNNKYFAENSTGIKSLERILNTFAKYDPQIGYVQGMNFIAASLLFHAEEYLTFWLLVMIFEIFEMRDIYLPRLPGLSKHCQIIDMLIFNYQPSIYLHLCQHEIRVDVFCTEWILALFASVVPVENMANFYDLLLGGGWPFFYKIILAFLQHFEKQIKEQDDLMGILMVLKSQNHMIKNSNEGKNGTSLDWNCLFQKAQKIEIDSHFIYKMHSNFDVDNQWFRTSFLDGK